MIKEIEFDNFKCLHKKTFRLGNVNVFTGYNGRGKSSTIQSILMLSQSVKKGITSDFEKLHLNGDFVKLGSFEELLTDDTKDTFCFKFKLLINEEEHRVELGYKLYDDFMVGTLVTCMIDGENYFDTVGSLDAQKGSTDSNILNKQLPAYLINQFCEQNVHFVAADRVGPVKFVEMKETPDVHRVGADGSLTINALYTYKERIDKTMNVDPNDTENHTLDEAVSMWIDNIMNGGSVNVSDNASSKQKKQTLSLGFNFEVDGKKKEYNSYNVGFGYSYILSIVVTALIAKKGSMVFVENPEAHLHPSAQLRLTYLLAKLAARGVQVFIETHSEHVVNGFRLAALKDEYQIKNDEIKIFFFDEDFSMIPLAIEPNGRIKNWPNRFFDQYNNELAEIIKLGAKVK